MMMGESEARIDRKGMRVNIGEEKRREERRVD